MSTRLLQPLPPWFDNSWLEIKKWSAEHDYALCKTIKVKTAKVLIKKLYLLNNTNPDPPYLDNSLEEKKHVGWQVDPDINDSVDGNNATSNNNTAVPAAPKRSMVVFQTKQQSC